MRSYRTISPLPPAAAKGGEFGGVFLWHFPWGRPRRALPGTVLPWSPDFPPSAERTRRRAAIRPSDWEDLGWRAPPVKSPESWLLGAGLIMAAFAAVLRLLFTGGILDRVRLRRLFCPRDGEGRHGE